MIAHAFTTYLRHTGPRVLAARKGVVRPGGWDIGVRDDFRDSGIRTCAERMRRRREH